MERVSRLVGIGLASWCAGVACSGEEGGTDSPTGGGVSTGGSGAAGSETGGVGTGGAGAGASGDGGSSSSGGAGTGSGGAGATSSGGNAGVGGSPGTGGAQDAVTRTASTYEFRHFPIEANDAGVWEGGASPADSTTTTTFDTVILENGSLRVTLLPDYGGRILSIVHKPTDKELLYQNPIGTPYLMHEDIFYYDYLVILGGIFPSFPEPEHGRYWNRPYAFEVVSESEEAITVRMSRQDDLDVSEGVPEVYDVGRTGVLVELDVTLRAGRSNVELVTKLTNTTSTPVPEFEYWTVTTLAPGSPPGNTAIPENTRILADMDQVHLLESSWTWFGDAETRVSDEVFVWDNLSYFENWVDQGTAFANPSYDANWSGLVNYDSDMGVLRVTAGGGTSGLKLWTFGTQSLSIDPNDGDEWLRPTIEMWHGITPEFWDRASLSADEVRTWSDSYFPTLGLREVTAASDSGALFLSTSESGADTVLRVDASLTLPHQTLHAVLRLGETVVLERDVVVPAAEPLELSAPVPTSEIAPGSVFAADFTSSEGAVLSGQISLP